MDKSAKINNHENLLMQKCGNCTQYYSIQFGEPPALACRKCGQGAHPECYDDHQVRVGITLVYTCSLCKISDKPTEPNPAIPNNQLLDTPASVPDESGENVDEEEDSAKSPSDKLVTPAIKVVNAYNLDILHARYPKPTYKVCIPYMRGNCPHGKLGFNEVDGEQCRNLHPKKCFRWMSGGHHEVHGCTKGPDCEYNHPVLCKNSVRYRKCFNTNCTFTHLRFTKRPKANNSEDDNQYIHSRSSNQHDPRATHASRYRNSNRIVSHSNPEVSSPWEEPTETPAVHKQIHSPENQKNMAFLVELIESMKKDMKTVNTEMEDFKKNLTEHISTQVRQQSDNINQELQEMRAFKMNLLNQQFQQVQQTPAMQTNPAILHQPLQPPYGLMTRVR